MTYNLADLIRQEGWEIKKDERGAKVLAYGEEFPLTHPCQIHLKRYREEIVPNLKLFHMKAAHDYLWPQDIKSWHSWTQDRFESHCEGFNFISWAGCASSAKSYDAAKIALLFWLANPRKRAVLVASTTLLSMGRRVWGYTTKLLNKMEVKLPFQYLGGNAPQILYPYKSGGDARDTLHGIMAAAAKQGSDEAAIANFIGTHPEEAMMLILDEATELPVSILGSIANLKSTEKPFQLIAIGNSSQRHDLHGSLSTPRDGWDSIDPYRDTKWLTTYNNGVCLFFNGYNSPAIHEIDPVKKKVLGGFLATEKSMREGEDTFGKDSLKFWRFYLGFWLPSTIAPVVMTEPFMKEFKAEERAHWLGIEPLRVIAGLDVAFSTGGDKCLLQLGYLGQTVNGDIVLDFRDRSLLFHIGISPTLTRSGRPVTGEIQIAEQVEAKLREFGCPLWHLAIDATGQGRAVGGTLQLQMKESRGPLKIYTTRMGGESKDSFDVILKTRHELWFDLRRFVETGSIKGVNSVAQAQFTSRLIIQNPKTQKQELETKKEFKARMGAQNPMLAHSPDEADVCTLALQSAIINYGFYPGEMRDIPNVPLGVIQEIQMWKAGAKLVQEGTVQGYPKADFSSTELKKDNLF